MSQIINPRAILNADSVTIGDCLKGSGHEVPDYQRDFSWGEDEIGKLWSDIKRTWQRSYPGGKRASNLEGHFLGAVVTQRPQGAGKYPEVIDGQQRLTTFSILISVLHEFATKISDDNTRMNVMMQLLPLISDASGSVRTPRLVLARDQDFFDQSVIQNLRLEDRRAYWERNSLDKEPVRQRIRDAILLLHSEVTSLLLLQSEENRDAVLSQLVDVSTELMMVLHLEVIDHRMAYRVFETLNFRGLDLSQADLLKNELVRRAEAQGTRADVVSDWRDINKLLDRIKQVSLVEFLQYHFSSKYSEVRASDLFESVVHHLDKSSLTAKEYTWDLVNEAGRVVQLIEGDPSWSSAANEALVEIREILGLKFSYPLLMAAAARFANSPVDFNRWAVRIRNFCFRYATVGRNSLSAFENVMTTSARSLRNTSLSDDVILDVLRSASPDEVFVDRFAKASVNTNKMGFYIIKSIEDHISGGSGKTLPQSPAQHLEHIMPKKPGNGWPHVSEDANYDAYVVRIGNLLGLEQKINSHIKNRDYSYKLSNDSTLDYSHSAFTLPKSVDDYTEQGNWTFSSIEKRQADLARLYAPAVWPLA